MLAFTSDTVIASSSFLSTLLIMYRIRQRNNLFGLQVGSSLVKNITTSSAVTGTAPDKQRKEAPTDKRYVASLIQLRVPSAGFLGVSIMFSNDLIIAKCVKGEHNY